MLSPTSCPPLPLPGAPSVLSAQEPWQTFRMQVPGPRPVSQQHRMFPHKAYGHAPLGAHKVQEKALSTQTPGADTPRQKQLEGGLWGHFPGSLLAFSSPFV